MGTKQAFANFSDEFKAKAKNLKTMEEFEALVKEENIELTPEQVEALAGGAGCGCNCVDDFYCPVHFDCMKVG